MYMTEMTEILIMLGTDITQGDSGNVRDQPDRLQRGILDHTFEHVDCFLAFMLFKCVFSTLRHFHSDFS